MRSIKNKIVYENSQILRPLIEISKKNIISFNNNNKIKFILDPSNQNLNYTRTIVRNFLISKASYKKDVKKDFNIIKNNYKFYKQMVFQSFHKIVTKINKNSIYIDYPKFSKVDALIQVKIIEIIYKYLKFTKKRLRYSQILFSIDILNENSNSKLNLGGLLIKKDHLVIKFIS